MSTIQTISENNHINIQTPINAQLLPFKTLFIIMKITTTEHGKFKCIWEAEGLVISIKWYNGQESDGYFFVDELAFIIFKLLLPLFQKNSIQCSKSRLNCPTTTKI
jgi:hypothetical protein